MANRMSPAIRLWRKTAQAILAIAFVVAGESSVAEVDAKDFMAGAAKVDISPDKSSLSLGHSVRDPLYARALYLSSGADCALLVEVDKGLVFGPTVEAVRDQFDNCPAENVFVWATHTHSGNDLQTGPSDASRVIDSIVRAAEEAQAAARAARMGFGKANLYLNINRDAFDGVNWYQGPNPNGPSDKTMSVLYFVDEADAPIGLVMNYGMHPISFFLSGVVSADFPGEASKYVEEIYPGAVALFSQGAGGDQNPLLSRPLGKLIGMSSMTTRLDPEDGIGRGSFWVRFAEAARAKVLADEKPTQPLKEYNEDQKASAIDEVGRITAAMGAIMGETAIEVMRDRTNALTPSAAIWSGSRMVSCPGRDRIKTTIREGFDPGYKDGADVNIEVSLLRLGNIALVGVNGEVFTDIVKNLKEHSPFTNTAVISLANGLANSGYIYSNAAGDSLSYEVITSRLKPGCAEDGIVSAAQHLMRASNQ